MNDFFFEQHLRRIEREGNDPLHMIQQFGAEAYGTYELEHLLPKAEFEAAQIQEIQRRLLYVAVSNVIWVPAAMFSALLGQIILAYFFAACIPLSILVFMIGHRHLKNRYHTIREEESALTIILKELAIRENYLEA